MGAMRCASDEQREPAEVAGHEFMALRRDQHRAADEEMIPVRVPEVATTPEDAHELVSGVGNSSGPRTPSPERFAR